MGGAQERCTTYPLEPDPYYDCTTLPACSFNIGDQCDPESGPGDYLVRYRVNGIYLPFLFTAHLPPPDPFWLDLYRKPPLCRVLKQGSAVP